MNKTISKTIKYFFLVCSILFALIVTSQNIETSLSFEKINKLIDENKYSNPDFAEAYAKLLLKKGKKEKNNKAIFNAYNQLGRITNIKGAYPLATQYCDKAIDLANSLSNKDYLFEAFLTKGNALVYLGNNKDALNIYMNAIDIAKNLKNITYEIRASGNIAKIKRRVGRHEEALFIYKKNLSLVKKNNLENEIIGINAFMGVAGSHLRLNQPDSTLYYSEKGLEKSLKINDHEGVSYFYNDIGMAYFKKDSFENAIDFLKKSEDIILRLNNTKRLTEAYYFIGNSYYKLNDLDNAITYLKSVENIVTPKNNALKIDYNPPEILHTYKLLATIYKDKGMKTESLYYSEKYIDLDMRNDSNKDKVIKDLFETKEKEVESVSEIALKQKSKLKYLLIAAGIVLILFIIYLFKFLKTKKENKVIFKKLLDNLEKEKQVKKAQEFSIQDEKVALILKRLDKLEASKYYLNSSCNLQNMAKKLKTNSTYLSKIIGAHKHKSFYEYLNELRIQYVLQHLKENKKFRNYSVKYIAQEIGYKSANSFTKHFKAYTKLYPSYYIKNIEEHEDKSPQIN